MDFSLAKIPVEKFSSYSMDPTNPENDNKHQAFQAVGFELDTEECRANAADEVIRQLRQHLALHSFTMVKKRPRKWAVKCVETCCTIQGPEGRKGDLIVNWWLAKDGSLKLITNWLKVHST